MSYPALGKHLRFDGTLLHGCPHGLARAPPPPAESDGGGDEAATRLTLLVNLWRRHRPVGPLPLPQRAAAALAASEAGSCAPRYLARRAEATAAAVAVVAHRGEGARRFAPTAPRR